MVADETDDSKIDSVHGPGYILRIKDVTAGARLTLRHESGVGRRPNDAQNSTVLVFDVDASVMYCTHDNVHKLCRAN